MKLEISEVSKTLVQRFESAVVSSEHFNSTAREETRDALQQHISQLETELFQFKSSIAKVEGESFEALTKALNKRFYRLLGQLKAEGK